MPNVTCQCQVGMSTDNVNVNVSAGQISRYHEISNYVWETKSEDMGKRTRKNLPKTFSVCFTFSNKKENQKRRAWKMKTRHENMGNEIYMKQSTQTLARFLCFAFSHSIPKARMYPYMWKIQHCSVGDCFSSFSCLLFHAIVCVLWEKYEIDGSSAQNLVLTKIDMKGASAVWRERRDGLLEGKIPRWVLLEKAPTLSLHFETVKSQTFFEFLFSFGILWQTQEVRIFI